MDEEFDWSLFFGCLAIPEKVVLSFIDVTRSFAFYILADLTDAIALTFGLTGLRYEVFKETYFEGEYVIEDETPIRFYELNRRLFKGLRTYLNSSLPERCRTVGVWNTIG